MASKYEQLITLSEKGTNQENKTTDVEAAGGQNKTHDDGNNKGRKVKGKDYINSKERSKIIINNTKTNQNYTELKNEDVYDFAIVIKGYNESELDIDIGWVLISKSKNNKYKIEKEWTWNGLTGIKKGLEEKEEKYAENVPPLQWKSGNRIECRLDLKNGTISYHLAYDTKFEAFCVDIYNNEEMGIFCPVISSVKYQYVVEWEKSSLNKYWAKQNKEDSDNTFHC
eukprot:18682_1